jgi:hypothetical protein
MITEKQLKEWEEIAPNGPWRDIIPILIKEVRMLHKFIVQHHFHDAPCPLCGYNGPGYYQAKTHPCSKLWHVYIQEESLFNSNNMRYDQRTAYNR